MRAPETLVNQILKGTKKKFKGTPVITCGNRGILRLWDSAEKECVLEESTKDITTEYKGIW